MSDQTGASRREGAGPAGEPTLEFVSYKNKPVVITGCFSGMGEAATRLLLDLGAEVHGLDYKDCRLPWRPSTMWTCASPPPSMRPRPRSRAGSTRCSTVRGCP